MSPPRYDWIQCKNPAICIFSELISSPSRQSAVCSSCTPRRFASCVDPCSWIMDHSCPVTSASLNLSFLHGGPRGFILRLTRTGLQASTRSAGAAKRSQSKSASPSGIILRLSRANHRAPVFVPHQSPYVPSFCLRVIRTNGIPMAWRHGMPYLGSTSKHQTKVVDYSISLTVSLATQPARKAEACSIPKVSNTPSLAITKPQGSSWG
jgi:hypothetical protein